MLIRNKKWKNLILLSSLFFCMIMFVEIIPRFSELFQMAGKLYDQKLQMENARSNELLEKSLTSENIILKNKIGSIISSFENSRKLSSVINFLDEASVHSNCDITSIRPGTIKRQDNLWMQPLELKINSDYESIYNFMRFIEHSDKVFLVKKMNVRSEKMASDSLIATANVEVYLNL